MNAVPDSHEQIHPDRLAIEKVPAVRVRAVTAHIRPRWALSPRLVEHLSSMGKPRTVQAGTVFGQEGDPPDHIHLILSGGVRGFVGDDNGRRLVLGELAAGEYCGEMLFDGFARCISTVTLATSSLVAVPRHAFMHAMATDLELQLHVMRKLAMRVITSTELVRRLALTDVRDRVQQFLLEAASAEGNPRAPVNVSQQAIGDRVGATRSMVNRVLKAMTADGDLEHTPGGIALKRLPAPIARPPAGDLHREQSARFAGERSERLGAPSINGNMLPARVRNALLALPAELLQELRAMGRLMHYAPGDSVCEEGTPAEFFGVLIRGRLNMTLSSSNGRSFALGTVLPGEYFGELVLIEDASRMASATAAESCEVLQLDRTAFMRIVQQRADFARHLTVRLSMRLRQLTHMAKQLALLDVQSRILSLLRDLSDMRADGSRYIAQVPSQHQIGECVGASRSMVNRVMRELSARGLILTQDAGIVLLCPRAETPQNRLSLT